MNRNELRRWLSERFTAKRRSADTRAYTLSFEQALAQFSKSFDLNLASFVDDLGLDDLVGDDIIDVVADKLSIESSGIDLF